MALDCGMRAKWSVGGADHRTLEVEAKVIS
jgi:hypothetical protein